MEAEERKWEVGGDPGLKQEQRGDKMWEKKEKVSL